VTLSDQDQQLVDAARAASLNAYTPYSGFNVGAALRCADGTIVSGCNVENASFGLTVCAERTAFVRAVAAGHRAFSAIAVWVDSDQGQPCGACRQFMSEFGLDLRVLYVSSGEFVERTIGELLPDTFVPGALDS
jgi:cytidine deaminase